MRNNEIRYERKWELSNFDVNSIILRIHRSNFNFSQNFQERSVNSIYFDDKNLSSIYQNLDGLNKKIKYRVRWYGERKIIFDPKIEIKSKQGFITLKKIHELADTNDLKFDFNGINKLKNLVNDFFENKKILIPITSTHYNRYYFISSNNLIRATLDTEISSSSLYKHCNPFIKKNFKRKIFELKYPKKLDNFVRSKIQNLFPRLTKSSKYIFSSVDKSNFYSV